MEEERKSKIIKSNLADKFTTYLFYASVLIFLVAFNFQDSRTGGWYLQIIPNIPISDVTFLDSLTGYAVSNNGTPNDTGYIIKTTNGGDNWSIIYKDRMDLSRIKFINQQTGFTCGGTQSGTSYFFKTTNAGVNWNLITTAPFTAFFNDMVILNNDTIWLADGDGLVGGLYRTTNGCQSWTNQFYQYNNNPDRIYMYNKNFGFMNRDQSYVGRTTDGGFNWTITNQDSTFFDMHFIDTLTGWRAYQNIYKTTNGGINWYNQYLPNVNGSIFNRKIMLAFSFINKDTAFGVGGLFDYPNNQERGVVYKTTNGGNNWGYQIPDTSFKIFQFRYIDFLDKYKGWAFRIANRNIYTLTGGSDTTFYTKINSIANKITKDYVLEQNYPNPFNPVTKIKYSIKNSEFRIQNSELKIIVYNILGKKVTILVNEKKSPGIYEVKFDGGNLSSGIYFYSMFVDGNRIDTKKMALIK